MKKIGIVLLLMFNFIAFAQQNPVKFKTSVKKISTTEFDLIVDFELEEAWHLYSQHSDPNGSQAAKFTFKNAGKAYDLVGDAKEGETHKAFNDIFEVEETFFSDEGQIIQRIKLKDPNTKQIDVDFFYQVCKESCISRTENLSFSLTGEKTVKAKVALSAEDKKKNKALILDIVNKDDFLKNKEKSTETVNSDKKKSLFQLFLLGFLGGLIALLTPCVFPMIPLTVSFFTKQGGDKKKGLFNAFLYGFFIVMIYLLLSVPFHLMDSLDPEILNNIATNVYLNVFFFVIFIVFALSFFGYYELQLPQSWGNKMDNASNAGGIIGIFFMALTLAIVSFSCTGPVLGSLLAGSLTATGGATQLTIGMLGFGIALALPFVLFAIFPNWLQSLPRSGGWMTTVKVVLGFLEVAFALKFLSSADLVSHWGILPRVLFIILWIVIFGAMALYLFGFIKFPHDPPKPQISKPRFGLGLINVAFVAYLGLGLAGVINLPLLAGLLPPMEIDNINIFHDYDKAKAYAVENNKPMLLDFTGYACQNCRRMEENVWTDAKVNSKLANDYVIVSLYVDDKANLAKEDQFKFLKDNGYVKEINTVGDKWSTFQSLNFGSVSQPYYVLLSPKGDLMLNKPQAVTDANSYDNWLAEGLKYLKE
jgi:thiol:disulfide interchange protein DsbD